MTNTEEKFKHLISVFATVKSVNTNEWMDYAAVEINKALECVGDLDRVYFCKRNESLCRSPTLKGVK